VAARGLFVALIAAVVTKAAVGQSDPDARHSSSGLHPRTPEIEARAIEDSLSRRCNPKLSPYLASINLLPADADVPGALIGADPISSANAAVKRTLLENGFSYTLF